jgi:hypothetical protein
MAAVVVLLTVQASATDWPEQAKLTASDAAASDYFGSSVSISGDYALIGASNDNSCTGSAYIFGKPGTGWGNMTAETAKLTASDAVASDFFGHSVSISGNYAIVGASDNDHAGGIDAGSAYIFEKSGTGWASMTETAKLTASDAANSNFFGWSVSISGDYAVVGAYRGDGGMLSSGSAYIFKRDGTSWSQQAKLAASDPAVGNAFGWSVSISGDYAVIGAYHGDSGVGNSGSAYIFEKPDAGWADMTETAKLTASDAASSDYFGCSVSIDGEYAVVGAEWDEDAGNGSGSAYIFEKPGAGWADMTETAKLTASDAAEYDRFGRSVSISGDCAVVGAWGDDDGGSDSGSAYIFKLDGENWTEQDKLTSSDAGSADYFGWSVSIDDGSALVGALFGDSGVRKSGSAYVFVPEPATASLLLLGAVALLKRKHKSQA